MKLLRPLLRGLPIIAGILAVCVFLAFWYLKHATPMYESTAKIRLADPSEGAPSANLYKNLDLFANTNKIGTEVEMLKSRVLVDKVLDSIEMETIVYRLGNMVKKELYKDAPFRPIVKVEDEDWYGRPLVINVRSAAEFEVTLTGGEQVRRGKFGIPLSLGGVVVTLEKNEGLLRERSDFPLTGKYEVVVNNRQTAVAQALDKLDITSVDKDVPILRMIFKSAVPQKAADFVNILANAYVEDYVSSRYKAADITVRFLDKQLEEVARRLAGSEDAMERYRTTEKIVNIGQETETDLRKIAQLKIQFANLQMSLSAIDTLNAYIQNGKGNFLELAPNFEAFTDLLSTEMIKRIKQLQSDREDLLTRFTVNDEKVRVIDDKLKDITSYLVESIRNTRKNYLIKYQEIDNAIKEAEKVFIGLPTREKDMAILERNFNLNEKIYNFLHEKRTDAGIARAATISFHRVIAHGEVPARPVSPNRVVIIAVSAVLGLLGGVSLIYVIHTMKAKVNDSSFIEKTSETPVVAEVLMQENDRERFRHFCDLAIQLELRGVITYPCIITFSSFADKEGKSYNAANIARGIVALGRRVLIVDIGGNIPLKQSWNTKDLGMDGISMTSFPGLFYYNGHEETPDGVILREVFDSKVKLWKQQFDVVVIRNEPLSDSANALVYMSMADVNVFIFDSRRTPAKKVMEADVIKEKYHIPNLKFLLNRAFYNPGVLKEAWGFMRQIFQKFNKRSLRR